MRSADRYPRRRPGDAQDELLARRIAETFRGISEGFDVRLARLRGETVDGERGLVTVVARLAGAPGGQLVVVAHRDALGDGARAELSGTAAMLELARVVSGQLRRSITFASTSGGSGGAAGARDLARRLAGPADAVLVLGDLAGAELERPLVAGWSNGPGFASLRLRRTVEAAVRAEAGTSPGAPAATTQWARLAFPFTVGEQGPFVDEGLPAVLLSASGERGPRAGVEVLPGRLQAFGRAALRSVLALDGAPSVPSEPEQGIVTVRGKVLPAWAVRLLVAALLLPPAIVAVDGFARVRRRRLPVLPWLGWLGATALPFLGAAAFAWLLGLTGLIGATPPQPAPPAALPLDATGRIAAVAVALVFVLGWIVARGPVLRRTGSRAAAPGEDEQGAVAALLLALVGLAALTWVVNPWAAALFVAAAHLWLVFGAPVLRASRAAGLALVAVAAAPFVLVVVSAMTQLGMDPAEALWFGLLLVAGGHAGPGLWVLWSLLAACFALAARLAWRGRPAVVPARPPTPALRSPLTYAGSGLAGRDRVRAAAMMLRPRAAARRRRRVLRRLSTVLIVAGALVLADAVVTVVWLEPVTALRTKLTQDGLERDLERLEALGPTPADLSELRRAGLLDEARVSRDRARAARRRVPFLARGLARRVDDGDAIGRLRVPRLDLDLVVVKGSSPAPLRKGPGTFDDTPLPGAHGTAAIAGHRTTYGAPFRDIDALRRGDPVRVTMPYATIRYRVEGHRIVDAKDLSVLRRVGHDRLILSACHPRFSAEQRIIVFARVEQVLPRASDDRPARSSGWPRWPDEGSERTAARRTTTFRRDRPPRPRHAPPDAQDADRRRHLRRGPARGGRGDARARRASHAPGPGRRPQRRPTGCSYPASRTVDPARLSSAPGSPATTSPTQVRPAASASRAAPGGTHAHSSKSSPPAAASSSAATPSCSATSATPAASGRRSSSIRRQAPLRRPTCAASVAMPSERSMSRARAGRRQRAAGRQTRLGAQVRGDEGVGTARPSLEHRQAGRGPAERARDAHAVARAGAVAPDELVLVVGPAHDGDRDRQHRRAHEIAAGDRRLRPGGQRLHGARDLRHGLGVQVVGNAQRDVGLARVGAHRGEVRQRRRHRAVPGVGRRQRG